MYDHHAQLILFFFFSALVCSDFCTQKSFLLALCGREWETEAPRARWVNPLELGNIKVPLSHGGSHDLQLVSCTLLLGLLSTSYLFVCIPIYFYVYLLISTSLPFSEKWMPHVLHGAQSLKTLIKTHLQSPILHYAFWLNRRVLFALDGSTCNRPYVPRMAAWMSLARQGCSFQCLILVLPFIGF